MATAFIQNMREDPERHARTAVAEELAALKARLTEQEEQNR